MDTSFLGKREYQVWRKRNSVYYSNRTYLFMMGFYCLFIMITRTS